MGTIKLFRENVYLKESYALVVDFIPDTNTLVLDKSIFFPGGGGQSCDLGTIDNQKVLSVYEKGNTIFHVIDGPLSIGSKVFCKLDWGRRFDNMQRHCGEHILSGMFFREFGGVNHGFHMGDDYMTIDISLEDSSSHSVLTYDMALHAENCTNKAIWDNLPISSRLFPQGKDAKGLPLRKSLNIEDNVYVVCVGSEENASDCVACCGTHPSTSGQVGLVKIYKVEKNKDLFRVYFDAGARALKDYNKKQNLILELGKLYSGGKDDLLSKINAQEIKNQDLRNRFSILKKSVSIQRVQKISQEIKENCKDFIVYEFDDLSVEDTLPIGRQLVPLVKKLLVLSLPSHKTLLIFSNGEKINCGKLVKENASLYQGKGGGDATSARAIFPKAEDLPIFIDLLEKHLR